jgi:hypothetical protein
MRRNCQMYDIIIIIIITVGRIITVLDNTNYSQSLENTKTK